MANALTGDFDVVAQFSTGAINRILAAMHRSERFPHSLTLRVDDTLGPRPNWPSVVGSVDVFGDPTVNPDRIRPHGDLTGVSIAGGRCSVRDSVVNADLAGVNVGPIVPSDLQGRAQLQLSPPSIDVTDGSGSRVTVRMDVRARYLPDPNTPRLAEFVRGTLQITAPISQMGSEAAHVIDIDFKSPAVAIVFTSAWSSRPLSAEDLSAIHLLIGNALKTSFLPSNAVVPPRIHHLLFKTFTGNIPAVAVLLNVRQESGLGNAGTVNTPFLNAQDHFAFAAGADLVQATFGPTLESILTQPIPPIPVAWTSYSVQLNGADLELAPPDRIVMTFRGVARTSSWLPNFGFTVRQVLRLFADGATADFEVGDLTLHLSNDIADWIASPFKGGARNRIARIRDDAIRNGEVHDKVRRLLNVDDNLGSFLNALFASSTSTPGPPPGTVQLAYTGVDVRPAGIILRGSLAVDYWPPPHAEFDVIPAPGSGPVGSVVEGPDHTALKTWIPGGTVHRYEWYRPGQGAHFIDTDRFVLLHQEPGFSDGVAMRVLPGYASLCLTIEGARLTASGPVVTETVGATVCAYSSFPVPGNFAADELAPTVALVERDAHGLVRVTGHTTARTRAAGESAPHMLVRFSGGADVDRLEELVETLRESGRDDGTTAVVAVLSEGSLKSAPYVPGVTYAENRENAWGALYGLKAADRATTLIVRPDGKVAWRGEGTIDRRVLAAALREHVRGGAAVKVRPQRSTLRLGHRPPNILLEHAPGRAIALRKLTGRSIVLVFWRAAADASIEAIRDLQKDREAAPTSRCWWPSTTATV